MKLALKIHPVMVEGISVGKVEIIKLLRQRLNLSLTDAKSYVDRCVFNEETVLIPIPVDFEIETLLIEIRGLETPAKIEALVVEK